MEDIGIWNVFVFGSFLDFLVVVLVVIFIVVVLLGVIKLFLVNKVMIFVNLFVIVFIIFIGLYYVDGKNWILNFVFYGVSGVLRVVGSCFYVFVGFDIISFVVEEVVNFKYLVLLFIILILIISFLVYFGVVIVFMFIMLYD